MKRHHQLYALLILSIIFIPAAYIFVAAVFVVQMHKREYATLKSIKNNAL